MAEIEEISQRLEAGLINSTGVNIQNIFSAAAKKVFREKKSNISKDWKKRKKSKKWYDSECNTLKSN